jgi:hypothetical protein
VSGGWVSGEFPQRGRLFARRVISRYRATSVTHPGKPGPWIDGYVMIGDIDQNQTANVLGEVGDGSSFHDLFREHVKVGTDSDGMLFISFSQRSSSCGLRDSFHGHQS